MIRTVLLSGLVLSSLTLTAAAFATPSQDAMTPPKSVQMLNLPYSSSSDGPYTESGSYYNNAPVYKRTGSDGTVWSLYRRSNGYWYVDFNTVSEDWDGTIAYTTSSQSFPWTNSSWNNSVVATRVMKVSLFGFPYATNGGSQGDYQVSSVYNGAPVYTRVAGNTTWSLYKRADGKWYLDFNAVSEDWDGTVAYTTSAASWPWSGTWNNSSYLAFYTKSVFMYQTAYASTCGTAGAYEFSGTVYNNAPVYTRTNCGDTWSLYKRANGTWVLDYNTVSEDWDGTVNYTTAAASNPWSGTWNNSAIAFRDSSVTAQGAAYSSLGSAGEYSFGGTIYNNAPVYTKTEGGYTWSLYKRSGGTWHIDFNSVSEDWDGTIAYSTSASAPQSGTWNGSVNVTNLFDQ